MTSKDNQAHKKRTLVLLVPGFEEGSIVYCLARLREAGLPVSLIGVSSRWIKGLHGITVRTDFLLEQLAPETLCQLVIVSGGPQSGSSLLADPRVRFLFESIKENKGFVVDLVSAEQSLVQTGIPSLSTQSQLIQRGDMSIDDFADHLIQLILN